MNEANTIDQGLSSSQRLPPIAAVTVAVALFFAYSMGWKWISQQLGLSTFVSHSVMKILLAFVSVALGWFVGLRAKELGFYRSRSKSWRTLVLFALALGACASFLVLATKASGIPMMKQLALWQVILSVWVISSICEEVYVRGLWQSWMNQTKEHPWTHPSVIASAAIFGAMHLSLLTAGADALTAGVIVTCTTLLGYLCAVARRVTSSLYPAIVVHVAFNVGGLLGGILSVICFGIPK